MYVRTENPVYIRPGIDYLYSDREMRTLVSYGTQKNLTSGGERRFLLLIFAALPSYLDPARFFKRPLSYVSAK